MFEPFPVFAIGFMLAAAAAAAADFEAQPAPYQTVPRPADEETVSANPPCFVYPAKRVRKAYVVEFNSDAGFPAHATTRLESPHMLACPTEPLKPGRYFWRWQPAGASEWSAVREFTVPGDAPVVPFPDMDALVERIGTSRPRVQANHGSLPELRRRAKVVFGESWPATVLRIARRSQNRKLLPEPGFLPDRKDPRRKELYQKTFRATRPFFGEMATLAQTYLLTGDDLSGQEAKRRLLHIVSWDPRGSTSIGHNDEPATEVVRYCPTVFDRVYPLLSDDEKRRCVECLTIRMRDMMARWRRRPFEKHPYESHNMGYYLPDVLEASLALMGDAPVEEMLRYTMLQLWSPFYPPYGGADGGWCEGPNYWSWSTAVFARTYQLAESVTGAPVHRRSNMRKMSLYKLYGNPPYFQKSPFGDGHESQAHGGGTMLMLAALYSDPHAKWYAEWQHTKLQGMAALLFDASQVEAKPPYDLPQGKAFFDVGLAAMHSVLPDPTSNVAVLMRSCPFGSISHAFADQNTFVLDAYGEPLIIASGYYQLYGHPHHAQWTWETKASNSVLVNGEGQSKRDWHAKGRLATFQTTMAGDYAVGDAAAAYKGRLDRFDRRIVFLRPAHTGGEPVVVIRDELAAAKPSTFQFLLHALNNMRVAPTKQRVTISRRGARCRVEFLAPGGLTFEQTDQFPVPPIRKAPNQWHLTASTGEPAAGAASLIVIQPYRDGQSDELLTATVEAGEGCVGVRLADAKRMLMVLFRTDPKAETVKLGDVATDAQAASVCTINGHAHSAVQFQGAWLACGDVSLVEGAPVWVKAARRASGPAPARLNVEGQKPARFKLTRHDQVLRLVARAEVGGPVVHREVQAAVGNTGDGRLPVVVSVGATSVRRVLEPRQQDAEIRLSPVGLGRGQELVIMADEAFGGRLSIRAASARRVYGVNLLPHGSFEEGARNKPVGWRAGTITKKAKCAICCAPGGRSGDRCLKVTCIDATGGDFGAMLSWPGVAASAIDRKFRMSCWVKTDATSVAGLQVTSADWRWWKNTARLRDRKDWTETAIEFVLPAGENIAHVRLHMSAKQTGAELFVDDVQLVEVPAE